MRLPWQPPPSKQASAADDQAVSRHQLRPDGHAAAAAPMTSPQQQQQQQRRTGSQQEFSESSGKPAPGPNNSASSAVSGSTSDPASAAKPSGNGAELSLPAPTVATNGLTAQPAALEYMDINQLRQMRAAIDMKIGAKEARKLDSRSSGRSSCDRKRAHIDKHDHVDDEKSSYDREGRGRDRATKKRKRNRDDRRRARKNDGRRGSDRRRSRCADDHDRRGSDDENDHVNDDKSSHEHESRRMDQARKKRKGHRDGRRRARDDDGRRGSDRRSSRRPADDRRSSSRAGDDRRRGRAGDDRRSSRSRHADDRRSISCRVDEERRDGQRDGENKPRSDQQREDRGTKKDDEKVSRANVSGYTCVEPQDADALKLSKENVRQIEQKLSERSYAKHHNDFRTADAIRDDLWETYFVMLDDQRKQWWIAHPSVATNARYRYTQIQTEDGDASHLSGEGIRRIEQKLSERAYARQRNDFRTSDAIRDDIWERYFVKLDDQRKEWWIAHPSVATNAHYRCTQIQSEDGDDSQLPQEDIKRIEQRLSERSYAKRNGDYRAADAIRDELREKYFVILDDQREQWCIAHPSVATSAHCRYTQIRSESGDNSHLSKEDVRQIEQKLLERTNARRNGDYRAADAIRDELWEKFSVRINDQRKDWCAFSRYEQKQSTNAPSKLSEADVANIEQSIANRLAAQIIKDHGTASSIQTNLWNKYSVVIDDHRKQWTATCGYTRIPRGDSSQLQLSEADVAHIENKIMERSMAKSQKDYRKADAILVEVWNEHSVFVDDNREEWWVARSYEQRLGVNGFLLPKDEVEYIEQKLSERYVAKIMKDYRAADAIRSEIQSKYSIVIDDDRKEWWASGKQSQGEATSHLSRKISEPNDSRLEGENSTTGDRSVFPPSAKQPALKEMSSFAGQDESEEAKQVPSSQALSIASGEVTEKDESLCSTELLTAPLQPTSKADVRQISAYGDGDGIFV